MSVGNFDQHGLGIIAYAQVNADGSTPGLNSGLTVTNPAAGVYECRLPEGEDPTRTLIFIQPFIDGIVGGIMISKYAFGTANGGPDADRTIEVQFTSAAGVFTNHAFNLLVLRSVVPYEADAAI